MATDLLRVHNPRFSLPDRFIQPEAWCDGLTVEQIYNKLKEKVDKDIEYVKKILKEGMLDGGDLVQDGGPDPQQIEEWQESFRTDVARAHALSELSPTRGRLPAAVITRLEKLGRATLPWGQLLRGDISQELGHDIPSYAPPKMRYYPIILPQILKRKERVLLIAVDVSASVTQKVINVFITNVTSAAARASKVIVVTFDEHLRERYETTRPASILSNLTFNSGVHSRTSALEVFEVADMIKPSAFVILTDLYIDLPSTTLHRPLFVVPTGASQAAPYGRVYVMEDPWH
jgi:predicted metal-dependent peptidase